MRHVNYVRWADYVSDLFNLARFSGDAAAPEGRVRNVLELACGTGKLLAELSRAGYQMHGMDNSVAMVQCAAARCRQAGLCVPLWCGDMRAFSLQRQFDAVICLYDSMNYCRKTSEVVRTFKQVAAVLRPGGLFIFDVCTRWNCWRNFRNYVDKDECGSIVYHRHSYFKPVGNVQYNEFLIETRDEPRQQFRELHVQHIYALSEIRKIATSGPWQELACFKDMSRRPGNERADRVHFVFQLEKAH